MRLRYGMSPQQAVACATPALTGVAFASAGHLPFRDNVDHASRHGVTCIAEPGGSVRSDQVAAACEEYGITLARTGLRLFQH